MKFMLVHSLDMMVKKHFSLDQQLLAAPCTVCSWVRHGQKKMVCQGGGERPPDLPVPGSASACRYCIWMWHVVLWVHLSILKMVRFTWSKGQNVPQRPLYCPITFFILKGHSSRSGMQKWWNHFLAITPLQIVWFNRTCFISISL